MDIFRLFDIGGIVLFVLLIIYFGSIDEKNNFEYALFLFSIIGLLVDIGSVGFYFR